MRILIHHAQTCPTFSPQLSSLVPGTYTQREGRSHRPGSYPLPAPTVSMGRPAGAQAPAEVGARQLLGGPPAAGSPGYHSMGWSRCRPSPGRPPSGCPPTSPGDAQLGPGRAQLPELVPAVREAVHPLYGLEGLPWPVHSLSRPLATGEGSPAPHGHLRGPGSEMLSSPLKVTLPSAFLENRRLDALISKAPQGAPSG